MDVLFTLCVTQLALALKKRTTAGDNRENTPLSPRFSQLGHKGSNEGEKGLMSLLFHGPVAPRLVDFGIEDSNKAVKKEIELNEGSLYDNRDIICHKAEHHLEKMLNRLQENEQNQLDAVQESFYLQNEQLGQIQQFVSH